MINCDKLYLINAYIGKEPLWLYYMIPKHKL